MKLYIEEMARDILIMELASVLEEHPKTSRAIRGEYTETIPAFFAEHGINIYEGLDTKPVEKWVEKIHQKWQGKASIDELIEDFGDKATWGLVLDGLDMESIDGYLGKDFTSYAAEKQIDAKIPSINSIDFQNRATELFDALPSEVTASLYSLPVEASTEDSIGSFFVVTNPTKQSEIEDILFESSIKNMMLQAKGGLEYKDICLITKDSVRAKALADELLANVQKSKLMTMTSYEKFSEEKIDEMVKELKARFGSKFWVKPGYEFGNKSVLWSGESAVMPDGHQAFEYNSTEFDPKEEIWVMGVHKDLVKWADKNGLFWEWNDPGTIFAWPN